MKRVPLFPHHPRPLVFAHRGISSLAPENTLAAFRLARELGIPGIELDVHLSADGKLPVIHDHHSGRTGGMGYGKGVEIERVSWPELRSLDVGSWKDAVFSDQRIPLLCELFEEMGESVYYDVELKTHKSADYGLEAAVAAAISDAGMSDRVLVSSFNPIALSRFKSLMPKVATGIIWSGDRELPALLRHGEGRWIGGVDFLKPTSQKVGKISSFLWRKLEGYPVLPWVADESAEALRLLGLACEGLISNRPQDFFSDLSMN